MKTRSSKASQIRSYRKAGATLYQISFQLLGHQVRKRNFYSYEEAESECQRIRRKIRAGEWANYKAHSMTSMTLSEMYEVYRSTRGNKRAPRTIQMNLGSWNRAIEPVVGSVRVRDVSRQTLAMLVRELRLKGYTDNSISSMTAEVNNVLNLAVEFEVLDVIPTWPRLKAVAAKKELLTPEEVLGIINAVDKGAFTHQYQTMIRLQYELALRVSELIGLTVGKIDLEKGTILIDQQRLPGRGFILGPTKTNSSTVLPLSPSLIEELRPYVEERPPEVPLWISRRLQPVSRNSYDVSLRAAVQTAGIQKNISTHCLRASCLSYLVNRTNLSIMAVAHLARHSPAMLVSHYAQVDERIVNQFFSSKKSLEETLNCDLPAITGTDGR